MGLKEYDVEVDGRTTTLQLSDEDAKGLGLTEAKAAKQPANKAAKAPANKAASAGADKRAEAVERSFGGGKKAAEKPAEDDA